MRRCATASGTALFWLGIVLFVRDELPAAAVAWQRALVVFHEIGSRRGITNVISCIAGLVLRTGASDTAAALARGPARGA